MSLYVQESFVNKTKGDRFGDSEVYESRFETPSELYRHCIREYGRCTGKVFIDGNGDEVRHVGWTFLRSMEYEDSPKERYLREVWVTVYDGSPTRTTSYQYHEISKKRREVRIQ